MSEQTVAVIVNLIIEIIKPIAAVLGAAILAMILRKIGISVDAEKQAQYEKTVLDAIARAEEKGATADGVVKIDKLATVVADIEKTYPKKTADQIADTVHALLPRIGLGAAATAAQKIVNVEALKVADAQGGFPNG